MTHSRAPAVAGLFYPDDAEELRHQLGRYLSQATDSHLTPKALIVPHAGYIYSGPVAANAYAQLASIADQVKQVALFGPSHRVPLRGLAVSSADEFITPLGCIPVEEKMCQQLSEFPQVSVLDEAHEMEHSLEVQLPFLQMVLKDFKLIPIVVGDAPAEQVYEVMEHLWQQPGTIIIVSSDLSHYHDYRTAQLIDQQTTEAIEHLQPEQIGYEQACGRNPVNGLLMLAKHQHLHATTLDLRNSGDTAGSRERVVGYGAYVFH